MRLIIALLYLLPFASEAKLTVVTSIEPLYQLTTEIMHGAGKPQLLMQQRESAHHFAFRPSHLRLINQADVVIWIGREFESGLRNLPDILPHKTHSIELYRQLKVKQADGHIWYSPTLLPRIVELIAQKLGELDPASQGIYRANQQRMNQSIANWWVDTRSRLSGVKLAYILDHAFLSHLEGALGIQAVAVLHSNHGQHGGIASLRSIEKKLTDGQARCLLTNESEISSYGRELAQKFNLKIHLIAAVSGESFVRRLQNLSRILISCQKV